MSDNSLANLNDKLFSQMDKLSTENEEKLENEIKRSKAMVSLANTIIDNHRLVFDIYEIQQGDKSEDNLPDMLRVKKQNVNGG